MMFPVKAFVGEKEIMGEISERIDNATRFLHEKERPYITLTYAQALDGSIAGKRGEPLTISCPETLVLAHQLRAWHDAILVGIGTVLSDNPRLTVRLVQGASPQPVVVDSRLRFPRDAHLLDNEQTPWIATTTTAPEAHLLGLKDAGARILQIQSCSEGLVDFQALFKKLGRLGVRSIMVEGGARVISRLLQLGLVDQIVITIAPLMIGGLRAIDPIACQTAENIAITFDNLHYGQFGMDIVLRGDLKQE